MLVSLLDLPPLDPLIGELRRHKIVIRRAYAFEITQVRSFVKENFGEGWADEISVGFANKPRSVYIAIDQSQEKAIIVGFAAYECTCRSFFGPEGVAETHRRRGIGRALLIACLHGLREMGYAYGIIGGVGPHMFYEKACGATLIEGSSPGIYRDMLR
ncbi:MAG: GNAT family N-acetyltransferase [Candidatus Bathyarchaeota archaeon]